jgi:hypothetical protein
VGQAARSKTRTAGATMAQWTAQINEEILAMLPPTIYFFVTLHRRLSRIPERFIRTD